MVLSRGWASIELLLTSVIEWWLESDDFLISSWLLHLCGGILLKRVSHPSPHFIVVIIIIIVTILESQWASWLFYFIYLLLSLSFLILLQYGSYIFWIIPPVLNTSLFWVLFDITRHFGPSLYLLFPALELAIPPRSSGIVQSSLPLACQCFQAFGVDRIKKRISIFKLYIFTDISNSNPTLKVHLSFPPSISISPFSHSEILAPPNTNLFIHLPQYTQNSLGITSPQSLLTTDHWRGDLCSAAIFGLHPTKGVQ